uniref:ODF3A protein n=1 Tax=Dromaius novaehollandiae TaxID=8790 RepID=A0A8C4J3F4_DRONO
LTESPWVGTWKPHRPRGPVMAQFTSPGPKYSIPGTTGYLKHDPTKKQAPAYTWGRAKPPAKEDCSPGPCYHVGAAMPFTIHLASFCPLQVTLTKPQAPAVSFGIRHSKYTTPLILDT